jgi:hypothetical protein
MKKPPSYSIEYQQFNVKITAKEPIILPAYKGSTIRRSFGYTFKRVVCAIKDRECPLLILVGYFVYAIRINFVSCKIFRHMRNNEY